MKKVVLDTNILMVPGQFMVDIYGDIERLMTEPYTLVVLDTVLNELTKLAVGTSKDARAAQLGLGLVNAHRQASPTIWEKILGLVPHDRKGKKLVIVKATGHVDDAIVEMADVDTIVATNDTGLKRRLKKKKIKLIVLKSKKYLSFQ